MNILELSPIFLDNQLSMKIKACLLIGLYWIQRPCVQQLRHTAQQTFVATVNLGIIGQCSFRLRVSGGDMATGSTLFVVVDDCLTKITLSGQGNMQ